MNNTINLTPAVVDCCLLDAITFTTRVSEVLDKQIRIQLPSKLDEKFAKWIWADKVWLEECLLWIILHCRECIPAGTVGTVSASHTVSSSSSNNALLNAIGGPFYYRPPPLHELVVMVDLMDDEYGNPVLRFQVEWHAAGLLLSSASGCSVSSNTTTSTTSSCTSNRYSVIHVIDEREQLFKKRIQILGGSSGGMYSTQKVAIWFKIPYCPIAKEMCSSSTTTSTSSSRRSSASKSACTTPPSETTSTGAMSTTSTTSSFAIQDVLKKIDIHKRKHKTFAI